MMQLLIATWLQCVLSSLLAVSCINRTESVDFLYALAAEGAVSFGIAGSSKVGSCKRMSVLAAAEQDGVVAIVRLDDLSAAVPLTESLVRGGIRCVEFTFTNPLAGRVIEQVRSDVGDRAVVGAGTVLDPETARIAILSGAQFVVTPTLKLATIEICRRYSVPTVIGAFTPTEILTAWEAGAEVVKVFPASVGGPRYLKDVRGPLPQIKLIPTGGVSEQNASDFIRAGAVAIAAGSNLVDARTVKAGDWATIEARARRLVDIVREARAE